MFGYEIENLDETRDEKDVVDDVHTSGWDKGNNHLRPRPACQPRRKRLGRSSGDCRGEGRQKHFYSFLSETKIQREMGMKTGPSNDGG